MVPVPIIIAFLAGGAGGGLIGYLFGDSKKEAKIQRLTNAMLEYAEIAKRHEIEIQDLKIENEKLKTELETIRKSRSILGRLIVFIRGEYPDVLQRFIALEKNNKHISNLQDEMLEAQDKALNIYNDIKAQYPKEVIKWEKDNLIEL